MKRSQLQSGDLVRFTHWVTGQLITSIIIQIYEPSFGDSETVKVRNLTNGQYFHLYTKTLQRVKRTKKWEDLVD